MKDKYLIDRATWEDICRIKQYCDEYSNGNCKKCQFYNEKYADNCVMSTCLYKPCDWEIEDYEPEEPLYNPYQDEKPERMWRARLENRME